ncbi:hypothetical protein [Fibrella aquatilis]|uniref:Uncharacterized protein n=1 Tax=Fibrella aquatilis TaxID=2817059 RepID=A0A939G9F5_9BACT|nr:hypothetical protein [Fibrella aquatilis]MBO0934902.1 hypothetical protein [Fibrella aquatilis]
MDRDENRIASQLTLYLSAVAALAYLGGGIALMASSQSFGIDILAGPLRYALAVLLIIYGAFRGYRAIQRFREQ